MSGDIAATLAERGDRYGPFLPIASKISRILSGDPHYDDNWRDIAGYAMLIVDWLNAPTVKGVAS